MYSKKLEKFIKQNQKEEVLITKEQIQASEKGWYVEGSTVKKKGMKSNFHVSEWPVRISYYIDVHEEYLLFNPSLIPGSSTGYPHEERIDIVFINDFDCGETTISVPEMVITLPTPNWLAPWSQDGYGYIQTTQIFESEAEKILNKFRKEMDELLF